MESAENSKNVEVCHNFAKNYQFIVCIGVFIFSLVYMKGTLGGTAEVFKLLRARMVENQIRARGIRDELVLNAMNTVPRHLFVHKDFVSNAYDDSPLPIGFGQTISQPFMVACMAEAAQLGPQDKVLEIGTGCGYAAAVFSEVAKEVYTVETVSGLANDAKERLSRLGYHKIHCFTSDGSMGLMEHAPYDAIIVAASAPSIPNSLKQQLAPKGRMIIPVKQSEAIDSLVRVTKDENNQFAEEHLMEVRFVPLIGKEGFRG